MSAVVATRPSNTAHETIKLPLPISQVTRSPTIFTVDDLVFSRSQSIPDTPLVAYPESSRGKSDYVHYTARDLDSFANNGANKYASIGLVPKDKQNPNAEVVALLAPSNLDYVACIFALSRLGFAVLLLSNRLAPEAYISLLQKTNCSRVISSANHQEVIEAIRNEVEVQQYPLLAQTDYDHDDHLSSRYPRSVGTPQDSARISFIIHSSGSTGLPKPIFQTHAACLSNYSNSFGYRAFLTLPLYHNHGLSSFFRAIFSGKEIAMFNANLPLTGTNLIDAMSAVQPESFHGVPYALKLLAESERGIEVLRKCKLVLFGGSSCPDDLGDRLVRSGVYLVGHYGATEMGQLMTSFRPKDDLAWNYVRPLPACLPYIHMVPRGADTFECVVLDGLPSKVTSNCDNPPNSFSTSDLFTNHPTIPNAWKYLGRLDDRVTLVNGEKVLPITYEHQIRENEYVREACVFGVGRAFPGLVIVPSEKAYGLGKEELLEKLWPVIVSANSRVEGFSQISKEMVAILDIDTEYPSTDKGTLIRAAFYRKFANLIDAIYERFDAPLAENSSGGIQLDLEQIREFLIGVFVERVGIKKQLHDDTDFFEAGVDSLQAISARGIIMRKLDLGGQVLNQNVVFEFPNVLALADHLYALRSGRVVADKDETKIMDELIHKYSVFEPHKSSLSVVDGETIILTGATGSLGAHVLSQLIRLPTVSRVYCLVRANSPEEAEERVKTTLSSKKITLPTFERVHCLPSDLSREDLGLGYSTIEKLRDSLTTIIHCAWAVNFNLGVKSFENQHIRGAFNLLNLCLKTRTATPAKFFFCSSISVAAGTPLPAVISESYITDLTHAQNMGYARSKLVTENVIAAAACQTGMMAKVLRVGQIVGDTVTGTWNTTEAIPLMIRSAVTLGVLPALEETPSWLPVDIVAKSLLELSGLKTPASEPEDPTIVYHVQNSRLFHWTNDLLPALREAGLEFEIVPQRQWVELLRKSDKNPENNPTIMLLDFFAKKYDNDKPGREGLVFQAEKTGLGSVAIRDGYDVIGSGLIKKIVESWKKEW